MSDATCTADGCSNVRHKNEHGLCHGHYLKGLADGSLPRRRLRRVATTCTFDGCSDPGYCRNWCRTHYERWVRHGRPAGRSVPSNEERFWSCVDRSGGQWSCWSWKAPTSVYGYAYFRLDGTRVFAHRLAYQWLVGPIPDGLVLDHLCHTRDKSCVGGNSCPHRRCVNPAHLQPVSDRENIQRGRWAQKTHCKHGHEYTAANTLLDTKGYRYCRTCRDGRNATRHSRTAA